jgi:formate dehydrogenase major subunit
VPGLGTSFGRGGATTFVQDIANSDCVLIEGSNFAECHPVAFRFVMQAKERGATIIHVDPRFTRTSAVADIYAPIRSGTDIVFLGALINWLLVNDRWFKDYVVAFTNASYIVREDFQDTEDLDGLFSGWVDGAGAEQATDRGSQAMMGTDEHVVAPGTYDPATWQFETDEVPRYDGNGTTRVPKRDATLAHPRCVLNVLRRHFARYTADLVEDVCGTPRDVFEKIANTLADNSTRERTTCFAYAVGWTQHTVGVQYIRTAAILQMLLGNMGRPGGGIMALRGHANIQGATDIPTLYDLLPGYLPMPSALRDEQTLAEYLQVGTVRTGWWSNTPKYVISLLKAYYGDKATADNDYCFAYLPQIAGDYSALPTQLSMKDGLVDGYFVIGQNPASSGLNSEMACAAMERLKWMVVIDAYETETASFWRRDGADPATIGTEMFFLPSATVLEKEGTMVNTNRLLQWHDRAIAPAGEARSDLYFFYELGKRLRALYAGSTDPKDGALLDLTWDYESDDPHERAIGEPSAVRVLQEINGYHVEPGRSPRESPQVADFNALAADGSTACGCWIYAGVFPDKATNRARNRTGDAGTALDWGFAWPLNRRMLYNRASADADGNPWSERKRYMAWDAERKMWTGPDIPDFPPHKAPDEPAKPGAAGIDAHSGSDPFLMQSDGLAQIFVAGTLKDGPLPAHYEPLESVVHNAVYAQQNNPSLRQWVRDDNAYNGADNPDFPHVMTTYRLTEHSGIMTRYVPWLAELQPALFAEIDPELAVKAGIRNGEWMTIVTKLGEIEARALVSGRMRPLRLGKGRRVHQIGIPYNYGSLGHATGDSPGQLIPLMMDPNVSIHEAKTITCNVRSGRRAAVATRERLADEAVPSDQRRPHGASQAHGADAGEAT